MTMPDPQVHYADDELFPAGHAWVGLVDSDGVFIFVRNTALADAFGRAIEGCVDLLDDEAQL